MKLVKRAAAAAISRYVHVANKLDDIALDLQSEEGDFMPFFELTLSLRSLARMPYKYPHMPDDETEMQAEWACTEAQREGLSAGEAFFRLLPIYSLNVWFPAAVTSALTTAQTNYPDEGERDERAK